MTADFRTLSFLVHADSKAGKTTLAATSPLPLLAIDAEGSWKFIEESPFITAMYGRQLRVRRWDPNTEPIPQYDGTWEICMVVIRDWSTLLRTYEWVSQSVHQFASIVVDSISEIQRRLRAHLVGTDAMQIQHWGVILNQMDSIIRGFRDLTLVPWQPVKCVVFVSETREKNGKWRPYMQGQIEIALPYWMDVVGYLFTDQLPDANGNPTNDVIRRLLITPHPLYVAGERVQGRLGGIVDQPNITAMFNQVYPPRIEAPTTPTNAPTNGQQTEPAPPTNPATALSPATTTEGVPT